MPKILIVEDQPAVATALRMLLEIRGASCLVARSPREALACLDEEGEEIGVVVQDMNFSREKTSGEEGIALFRELRRRDPGLPVLLVTAWTSLETAVQLVKEGASDYLAKPWDDDKLFAAVRNLLQLRELQLENARLRSDPQGRGRRSRADLAQRYDLREAVWASDRMQAVVTLALQVAASEVPVLITGPSGAGKEKLAEIVQANSRRKAGPFIRVNAGALPDELLEAELFGAEAGAYTGAARRRTGRFEAADGGTLFLDEIGNLSAAGQAKLLRVLQSGQFERLGSSETRRVDVRLLAATNVDLRRAIAAGRFREDLFYRLNVVELALPSLAERPEDVLPLAESILRGLAPAHGGASWSLADEARAALVRHPWPGNVRELENTLRRAVLVASGPQIEARDLGLSGAAGERSSARAAEPSAASESSSSGGAVRAALDEDDLAERVKLERALDAAGGIVAHAAEALGLSRQAFYRKLEKHGLALERRVRG
jgi:DNA-binding NtrC family response regulator